MGVTKCRRDYDGSAGSKEGQECLTHAQLCMTSVMYICLVIGVLFETCRLLLLLIWKENGRRHFKLVLVCFRMAISGISLLASRVTAKHLPVLKNVTQQMFGKYLLLTNIGISASLSLGGDVIQQYYEVMKKGDRQWDKQRSLRMTASGVTVGFVCHYWYTFLDKRFPGKTLQAVMKKVVIDQLVCSPVYITVFFATTCYMEGKNFKQFKEEMVQKWWRLFLADCLVWPPAQVINFYFLPPKFRVLYDNVISLGCDIYTSYVKNEIPMKKDSDD